MKQQLLLSCVGPLHFVLVACASEKLGKWLWRSENGQLSWWVFPLLGWAAFQNDWNQNQISFFEVNVLYLQTRGSGFFQRARADIWNLQWHSQLWKVLIILVDKLTCETHASTLRVKRGPLYFIGSQVVLHPSPDGDHHISCSWRRNGPRFKSN